MKGSSVLNLFDYWVEGRWGGAPMNFFLGGKGPQKAPIGLGLEFEKNSHATVGGCSRFSLNMGRRSSIWLKAKHRFPRSFRLAPRW